MMWKPFGEIIPDDANFSKRIESDAFDIKMYSGSTKIYWNRYKAGFLKISINGMHPFAINSLSSG